MTVLSQSFFTLVRRHLMSFLLITVGHSCKYSMGLRINALVIDGLHENLGGLEGRNVVLGDDNRGFLGNVAGRLCGAFFEDKAAKASEEDFVAAGERVLYSFHKCLDSGKHGSFLDTRLLGNLVYDICFCHVFM